MWTVSRDHCQIDQRKCNIEPERQTELEAGLDFTILNNSLSVEFSWYNKIVKDFLLQRTVPGSSGFRIGMGECGRPS